MKQPKIVLWDLETMSDLDQIFKNIPSIGNWPGRTMKGDMMSIINVGWKILGEDKVHCESSWDLTDDINNDSAICHLAYEILHDADGIVTHNGKRFDVKVLNTRLAKWGLPSLPKMPHADTCVIARRALSLYSNRLNDVSQFFNLSGKLENGGWQLWVDVHRGCPKAKKLMVDYCKQDVVALEEVFLKLRQYAKASELPNYRLFTDKEVCPSCGSSKTQKHGVRHTSSKLVQRYRCLDCGATHSGTKNVTAEGL
jgi:hypothetical protein